VRSEPKGQMASIISSQVMNLGFLLFAIKRNFMMDINMETVPQNIWIMCSG
jgi:hypothetical protein